MNHFLFIIKFKTLIFLSLFILLCKFSYGHSGEMQIDSVLKPQIAALPKLRIGTQIGYGYRFLSNQKYYYYTLERRNYHSKIKNSLSFGADMSYYFGKYIGLGIKYNSIYAQAKLSKIPDNNEGNIIPLSEKIGIHYLAPFFAARYFIIPNKHCLFANVGAGLAVFRDNAILGGIYNVEHHDVFVIETAAFSAEIGYDFFVTKFLAIGMQVSTVIGLLKEHSPIIGHLDFTLGVRIISE